jgi:diadenosine tetraphosphate (Ap4A) HIT family hydrolase
MPPETLIHKRVAAAQRGENPNAVCRVPSGWVVFNDQQVVPGYCLLLPDPVVPSLNDLPLEERARFLLDMALLGDALLEVTGAFRINYEILGNSDPTLHAHIVPRYTSEPEEKRRGPIFFYDFSQAPAFDPQRDGLLMQKLASAIRRMLE